MDYQLKTLKATTIICVRRKNKQGKSQVAMAGDGQVTLGNTVMKNNANKVRRLYQGKIISGFAGAVADALTLYERIEENLEQYRGDLMKASVEMTRAWRTDKYLRRLEAMLLIADEQKTFLLSGTGEVIEPESDVIAIGSGGEFARSAALALLDNTKLSASEIARKSLEIAGKVCIYTNQHITLEEL